MSPYCPPKIDVLCLGPQGVHMAINVRCSCKNEYATRYQKCPKCGLSKNSKGVGYKVVIRDGSRKHTRLVDSITLARQ
jgi:hypothetical protein